MTRAKSFAKGTCAVAIALGCSSGLTIAQAPDPGKYSAAIFTIRQSIGNRVEMRDGVVLSADIYMPEVLGKYPAVLMITPYDNNSQWKERSKWFAQRGYVAVIADTRGRYDSEGVWDPATPKHKTDGYDLVEWIAKQPWCTGRVGIYGPSYMGWESWWTATQAPPSLKAMAPEVAPPDPFQNWNIGGVLHGLTWWWSALMAGRTRQEFEPYNEFLDRHTSELSEMSYRELNRMRGVMDAPWFDTWMLNNLSTAEYWRAIAYQTPEEYSKVGIPSLAATGWFDFAQRGSPMNYLALKQYGSTAEARHPRLVIGPWGHWPLGPRKVGDIDYGPEAELDWDGYMTRFFDHYLKGINNGLESDLPVHVFVMGANKWRAEKDWPLPQTQWTKYYFDSRGKANSFKGDGQLRLARPQAESSDTYIYDPAKPTRSPELLGAADTRFSAMGDEVLVYQTAPLQSAVEVVGPIEAVLYAATTAKDTDWFVRLTDVYPQGRSLLLAEGALRARGRNPNDEGRYTSEKLSAIEPGAVYQYTVQFWRATGNRFLRGHRIRVEISSSWYPNFLPNLNTGADNLATVPLLQAIIAKQTIHHGPKHPSHILLPVMPSDEIGAQRAFRGLK